MLHAINWRKTWKLVNFYCMLTIVKTTSTINKTKSKVRTIFAPCCYLRDTGKKLINENVTVISEASDHSRIAAFSCINKVFQLLCEKHNLPLKVTLHIWSDGCAGQFHSRYVFTLLTAMSRSVTLNWYYNERHHGKGSMDDVGGTLKNRIFRDVMSEKCLIQNAEEFSNYANTVVNGITSISHRTIYLQSQTISRKLPRYRKRYPFIKWCGDSMKMVFVILSFTIYPTTMSRSLHSIIERKMILRFVAMNCYRFRSTPTKPPHFVKESTRAKWNGSNVAFVSNGFMNIVSISDLLCYLSRYI